MRLLEALPADSGMAFVVIQHLDPRHASHLEQLLSRGTKMPVVTITSRLPLAPNKVFVLPPDSDVVLEGEILKLVSRRQNGHIHLPIDRFFQSLAAEAPSRAIGVVLSGTGSDGTLGLSAIKQAGGFTFAEAEKSAKYFDMPGHAIASGAVDHVLTMPALAKALFRLGRHGQSAARPNRALAKNEDAASAFPEAGDDLSKIFFLLKHQLGVDFSKYKQSTLARRIARRMILHQVEKLPEYVKLLRTEPDEVEGLFSDILISVTGFFRDQQAFQTLKRKVIPRILHGKTAESEIRVWVPGCATGEEAYSIAVCFMEALGEAYPPHKLQIFATDLSETILAKARQGIYPENIASQVSPQRLRRFFAKVNGGYQINRAVRDVCTFARQNLCEDPPFSHIDLISCRNVLIYLGPELQKKCVPLFHYALNPAGYLMLGTSETIGGFADLFSLIDKQGKIYVKKLAPQRATLDFGARIFNAPPPPPARSSPPPLQEHDLQQALQRHSDQIILKHLSPGAVVVDADLQVLLFRGRTAPYLEHAPGAASLGLLQMVRAELMLDLRTAIHEAARKKRPTQKEGLLTHDHEAARVRIQVVPFRIERVDQQWLLVLFEQISHASLDVPTGDRQKRPAAPSSRAQSHALRELRDELAATRESLRAIIEEREAANEELKSANEEIQSSNEELQSTNEELETAKEELQSANEELTTVNEELGTRNNEMTIANNDLNNVLTSTSIPIIIVDNRLAIRRFTPRASEVFNLRPGDIGRKIGDLRPNLRVDNLKRLTLQVIESLSNQERDVQDVEGHWHSLRIRPYRTADNKIDGAVITLIDIDSLKRLSELEVRQKEVAEQGREQEQVGRRFAEDVLDTVQEPLAAIDADGRVQMANHPFCAAFDTSKKTVIGRSLVDLLGRHTDAPGLTRALRRAIDGKKRFENFPLTRDFPSAGRRNALLHLRRLARAGQPLVLVSLREGGTRPGSEAHRKRAARNNTAGST